METIEHRITAHHGNYAAARENLDDSLKLLSNAADIYEHADDLSWTAEAKKMGQVGTATKGGPLVESSHLTRLG